MALSPGILQDVGLGFNSGKLSEKEYGQRRDACTKDQLDLLTSSPEYQEWLREKASGQGLRGGIGQLWVLILVVMALAAIFAQPFVVKPSLVDSQRDSIEGGAGRLYDEPVTVALETGVDNQTTVPPVPASPEEPVDHNTEPPVPPLPAAITVPQPEEFLPLPIEQELAAEELLLTKKALDETQMALHTLLEINADMEKSMSQAEADLQAARTLLESSQQVTLLPDKVLDLIPIAARHFLPGDAEEQLQRFVPYILPAAIGSGLFGMLSMLATISAFIAMRRLRILQKQSIERLHRALGFAMCCKAGTDARARALAEELSASRDALHALQSSKHEEVRQKESTAAQAKRWLDQAQGQLQNTQTALTVKEAEVKALSSQLDQAAADYASLQATLTQTADEAAGLRDQLSTRESELCQLALQLDEAQMSVAAAEMRAVDAEARAASAETCALDAETVAADAETRVATAQMLAVDAEARALAAETHAADAEMRAVDAESRAADVELRADAAEARAADAEARAADSEVRADGAEARAVDAEARAADAELRADAAEARAVDAEARAANAETCASAAEARMMDAEMREAELMRSTRDAGRQVGSVMDMMKSTRQSLERKINASQTACSALSAELSQRALQQGGQENVDPEGEEVTDSDDETASNYLGPDYSMHMAPSSSVLPLAQSSNYNHAVVSRNKSNARSPYWFAK